MSDFLESALTYARMGLPVFPMLPRSKGFFSKPKPEEGKPGHVCAAPLHQHGFKDATTDSATITAWWEAHPAANVGLATGRGLDVLDVDGPEGETTLAALCARRWPLPETCQVSTGREGGGRHIYFRSGGWPNTVKKLGLGLDTKALGGLVLLPPSVHPSGAVYAWTNLSKPAAAPAWLTEMLLKFKQPETMPTGIVAPRVRSEDDDSAIEQASRYLAGLPAAISGQGGHAATYNAARAMFGFELTEAEAFELMFTEFNPRCVPPWRESDLRRKVREAHKARRIPHLLETTGRAS